MSVFDVSEFSKSREDFLATFISRLVSNVLTQGMKSFRSNGSAAICWNSPGLPTLGRCDT